MTQQPSNLNTSRRGFMQGVGGIAALGLYSGGASLTGVEVAQAAFDSKFPIVPETPASADDLNPSRFKTLFAPVGNGVELAYVREGVGGVPLVLLHGWPWSKRLWWRNIEPLARAGFDVIVPDQRGTGESPVPKNPLDYVSMGQSSVDVRNLLAYLKIDRAVLVGGDFGCGVVLDMSNRFPGLSLRQCGFNGPNPNMPDFFHSNGVPSDQGTEVMAVSNHITEGGLHADDLTKRYNTDQKRLEFIMAHYLNGESDGGAAGRLAAPGAFTHETAAFHAEAYASEAHFRASFGWYEALVKPERKALAPMLGQIGQTETLILFGAEDQIVGPRFMDRMRLSYPNHVGPFIVPGAGHFLPWERPDVLNTALISFCRDLLKA